jgi:uncharacterized membrane protein SirB2
LEFVAYELILQTHAFALIGAIGCLVVAELLLLAARRDPVRLASAALITRRVGNVLATIGIIAGVALLVVGRWPLVTPWLIASFVLIALLIGVGRGMVQPWETRLKTSLGNGHATDTDIGPLVGDKGAFLARMIVIGLFALIIGLMTTKPDLSVPF